MHAHCARENVQSPVDTSVVNPPCDQPPFRAMNRQPVPMVARRQDLSAEQRTIAQVMDCIRAVVRALHRNTRAIERQLGISLAQLWVMQILKEHPGRTVNELAAATATHPSSVSVVVQRLVNAAFAIRMTGRNDKRQRRVDLTEAGRSLVAKAPRTVQVDLIAGLRRLAPERREALAALMHEWLRTAGLDRNVAPPMLMEDDKSPNAFRRLA